MSMLLNIEFHQIYNIHHQARQRLWNFAIFAGSNGYFKTEVLKELCFSQNMLTEDIDLSIRALLRGKKITFDSTIISYDQAPSNIKELWKQRTRWSQGWLQVSWKYAMQIWFHKKNKLSLRQKLGLLILLPIREIGLFIILQILPLSLVISIKINNWNLSNYWSLILIINLILLITEPFWIYQAKSKKESTNNWFLFYSFISLFYLGFKSIISLYAYFRQSLRNNQFEVTKKST